MWLAAQVLKMQSKWILQTLLRILGSPTFDAAVTSLQAFLPKSMVHFEEAVLSPSLAAALKVWHGLVHSLKGDRVADLENILQTASAVVISKTIQVYHKPITRVSSMTHYKRILKECHELLVKEKLDKEATQKANELQGLIDRLSPMDSELAEASGFCFDKVEVALKDGFGGLAQLHPLSDRKVLLRLGLVLTTSYIAASLVMTRRM